MAAIDDCDWSLSNPGPDELIVWLEPWAEELVIPARSNVALKAVGGSETQALSDIEWASDHIVVWANATTVEAFVDGVLQDTTSAVVPIPAGLSKEILTALFADQPSARLGGAANSEIAPTPWWKRLRTKFRLG
ncbi:hypothetical protein WBP07_02390 [Novosphingobium sp. BL-8A]|uniref:hypothetical protein n=1 Tax=Novosphingobium sp. BL-8A TaxID=3127639 RepID=UPI003756A5D1